MPDHNPDTWKGSGPDSPQKRFWPDVVGNGIFISKEYFISDGADPDPGPSTTEFLLLEDNDYLLLE